MWDILHTYYYDAGRISAQPDMVSGCFVFILSIQYIHSTLGHMPDSFMSIKLV